MHTQSAACQRAKERERELMKDADVIFCSMWLSHLVSDVMDWILTCAWSSLCNNDACIRIEMHIWVQRFRTRQLWGEMSIEGRLQHVGEGSHRGTGGFKLCRASQIESGCHSAACLCGTGYTDRRTALGEKNRRANPVSGFDTLVPFIKEVDSQYGHCWGQRSTSAALQEWLCRVWCPLLAVRLISLYGLVRYNRSL